MMIMQPDWITRAMVDEALMVAATKNPALPHDSLRFRRATEGRCLQLLHVGSYDDEGPELTRLHRRLMPDQGLDFNGHHHEIYLSDPRRTDRSRLRTILRQPVRPWAAR